MAYSKTTWKNRVVQNPQTYLQQQNADGTVTLIPKEGTVTEAGTPVNAVNMNNIEDGIATVDTNLGNINDSTLDASVKGKTLTEMIKVLFQNVDSGKNDVYSAIVGKGTTPASKDFADLVAGINAINTGKKWASGTITTTNGGKNISVTNIGFIPSIVILSGKKPSYGPYFAIKSSIANWYSSSWGTGYFIAGYGINITTTSTGFNASVDVRSESYPTTEQNVNWIAIE